MIVVTGGAGFIGSALIWELNRQGFENIVSIDDLGLGNKWKNLVKRRFLYNVCIDKSHKWLKKNQEKIEVIFHMGACSSTTERDADFLMNNNVHDSRRLWKICRDNEIPFIYASSAATYGSEESNFSDAHDAAKQLIPINKYGWSKQVFDMWVLKQPQGKNRWYGLKFFNVYGPQEYHKGPQASVAFHAYPQVTESSSLKLFKSYRDGISHGDQKRDFVYVKDVTAIMLHLWQESRAKSGLYNVGTGTSRSFSDLGKAVFASLNKPPKMEWIEMPDTIRDQYQYFTEANLNKLTNDGHYSKSLFSLEAGISDYVQNYLSKEDRYL